LRVDAEGKLTRWIVESQRRPAAVAGSEEVDRGLQGSTLDELPLCCPADLQSPAEFRRINPLANEHSRTHYLNPVY